MRKRLVYRIDDVGYTEVYDMGIKKVIESGIGCSADVMFDSMDCVEILKWLKDRPWISIGWHRHLWERPVCDPSEVKSMVDEEGRFKWRHRKTHLMSEATYQDCYKEFDKQMQLCYSILGKYPDVATSRNTNLEIDKAYMDILDKYNIAHGVFSTTADHKHQMVADEKYRHLNYISVNIQPDPSVGFDLAHFKEYNPLEKMTSLTWTEKEEIYFYGFHPGYCDDYIMAESSCNLHRCKELQAALSDQYRNWIIENKIELINQRDALYGTNELQDHFKQINSPLWIGNMK